jgi:hypothetical protein
MSQGQTPGVGAANRDQAVPVTEDRIREELSRVLASHEFRSSKRSQDFLQYVIENTLNGHADMLKERTIGIDVFGRPTSYDPSEDATVRVKAGEVRKRLGLYYSDQGARNPIRIELPSGTYVPEFHPNASVAVPLQAPPLPELSPATGAPSEVPPVERKPFPWHRWVPISGLIVVAAAWRVIGRPRDYAARCVLGCWRSGDQPGPDGRGTARRSARLAKEEPATGAARQGDRRRTQLSHGGQDILLVARRVCFSLPSNECRRRSARVPHSAFQLLTPLYRGRWRPIFGWAS